jgi:hypothetical protein
MFHRHSVRGFSMSKRVVPVKKEITPLEPYS